MCYKHMNILYLVITGKYIFIKFYKLIKLLTTKLFTHYFNIKVLNVLLDSSLRYRDLRTVNTKDWIHATAISRNIKSTRNNINSNNLIVLMRGLENQEVLKEDDLLLY